MLDRLFNWLDQNTPLRCHCGHWVRQKKDAPTIRHRVVGRATACKDCYRNASKWDKGGGR